MKVLEMSGYALLPARVLFPQKFTHAANTAEAKRALILSLNPMLTGSEAQRKADTVEAETSTRCRVTRGTTKASSYDYLSIDTNKMITPEEYEERYIACLHAQKKIDYGVPKPEIRLSQRSESEDVTGSAPECPVGISATTPCELAVTETINALQPSNMASSSTEWVQEAKYPETCVEEPTRSTPDVFAPRTPDKRRAAARAERAARAAAVTALKLKALGIESVSEALTFDNACNSDTKIKSLLSPERKDSLNSQFASHSRNRRVTLSPSSARSVTAEMLQLEGAICPRADGYLATSGNDIESKVHLGSIAKGASDMLVCESSIPISSLLAPILHADVDVVCRSPSHDAAHAALGDHAKAIKHDMSLKVAACNISMAHVTLESNICSELSAGGTSVKPSNDGTRMRTDENIVNAEQIECLLMQSSTEELFCDGITNLTENQVSLTAAAEVKDPIILSLEGKTDEETEYKTLAEWEQEEAAEEAAALLAQSKAAGKANEVLLLESKELLAQEQERFMLEALERIKRDNYELMKRINLEMNGLKGDDTLNLLENSQSKFCSSTEAFEECKDAVATVKSNSVSVPVVSSAISEKDVHIARERAQQRLRERLNEAQVKYQWDMVGVELLQYRSTSLPR